MPRDIFSLNQLQLAAKERWIAMRFEQRPLPVGGSSEPPVGVLLTVL